MVRLIRKRRGTFVGTNHTSGLQPFISGRTDDGPQQERRMANFAADMSELNPHGRKRVLPTSQRATAIHDPQSMPDSPRPYSRKWRGSRGIGTSARADPALNTISATLSPLDLDSDFVGETPNSDPVLRREVEHLRMELERIKQAQEMAQEAPPLYQTEIEHDLSH